MTENEMINHIELLQESLDEAMEIMLKIRTKIKGIKRALTNHRKTIQNIPDYNNDRKKADEKIWEILDYDELFS
jgi:hypothetical protein